MTRAQFSKICFAVLIYSLAVILWGAWVRISFSGDGCGDSWPLCQGDFVPSFTLKKTSVEFIHRMMSGFFGIAIFGLFLIARRLFPKGHWARKAAGFSLFFTITEALLGAKLVLLRLVGTDASPLRAFSMSLHLVNSLLLVGSLALTWDFSRFNGWMKRDKNPFSISVNIRKKMILGSLLSMILLAVTGALAALSTTLFPSESLLQGLQAELQADAHFLQRLRSLHPMLGLLLGGLLSLGTFLLTQVVSADEPEVRRRTRWVFGATLFAVAIGLSTLLSLSPTPMKLLHLTMTYVFWTSLVLWIRSLAWTSRP